MTSSSGLYDRLASLYDGAGLGEHARRLRPLLENLLESPPPPGRWIDLGCGTGVLLEGGLRGAGHGFGLDLSVGMLGRARRRGLRVAAGDARRLPLAPGGFSLATATFDLPNHMNDSGELARLFSEVQRILAPGGAFVFDANSVEHLRLWEGARQQEAGRGNGEPVSTAGRFDPARGVASVEFRSADGEPLGVLRERAYAAGLVESLLRRSGFTEIRRVAARRSGRAVLRWLWRADRTAAPLTAGS